MKMKKRANQEGTDPFYPLGSTSIFILVETTHFYSYIKVYQSFLLSDRQKCVLARYLKIAHVLFIN